MKLFDSPWKRAALGALAIVALAFVVYRPILPGNFLMDDRRLVDTDNPLTNGQLSPSSIWFQTDFALSTFAQWMEWRAWGPNPGWYHAVNIALHALSAILLWRVLARLGIRGAWLAGVLFAAHPVCVNSVARIAELKNTLSLPFFLLSLWFYIPLLDNPKPSGAACRYGLSLIMFVLALMAKTSTVMLPLVLLACAAWKSSGISWRGVLRTAPFFLLAAAFGLMSAWFQKHQAMAGSAPLAHETFGERVAMAGQVYWFYLRKAFVPARLNLVYPEWKISFAPLVWLIVLFLFCWKLRRGRARHVLFALGVFGITLFPALGFFDSQFLTHWRVSDHLQYLPLIAPVALMAAVFARFPIFSAILVTVFGLLTFQRAHVFKSEESLYQDTVAKNPAAWGIQSDLGVVEAAKGDLAGAMEHFRASEKYHPDNPEAESNIGQVLVVQGKPVEAEEYFVKSLKLRPNDPETQKRYAFDLLQQGRNRDALEHFRIALAASAKPEIQARLAYAELLHSTGDARQAVAELRRAIALKPDSVQALNNLAWLLATCWDDSVRDGAEAVRDAQKAQSLPQAAGICAPGTLAAAYAETGQFDKAIATAQKAVEDEQNAGQTQFANMNRQLLQLYRSGRPFHERPPGGLPP